MYLQILLKKSASERAVTADKKMQQVMHQMQQQQQYSGGFTTTTSVTTDHIQQYLDENKALILNILENQNTGKFTECAQNQTRLQQNLMYLAAIADSQPKQSPINLQPYMNTMQQQQLQSQHMVPQSPFNPQPPFTMMQQHHALQSQLGVGSSGTSGTHTPRSETSLEGFPDFSQPFFGENSQGMINRPVNCFISKERIPTSVDRLGESPQKKGKLNRAAN